MGALTSRQSADVEETDIASNHAYRYPPKSGNYFGSHFIMGGERFDTPQPEAYLFGENADLNFLGSRPTSFPYPPPQANEPTKTLKSLVNIRKESVRFVKAPDSATKIHGDGTGNKGNSFNIEFIYDSDAKCAITIYYFCTEEIGSSGLSYVPRDPSLTSETYHCKRGVNQIFSQVSHIFNPNLFSDEDLAYNSERDVFPIAIHCVVEEDSKQSHTTICVVDHHTDGTYVLRALKQKIFVDGLCYLLQEIYGIENKNINKATNDDDTDDNGSECVICMCDTRDTLILPCRHLCLCNSCADSLRYQANNCPICRAPFRALLQIKAVQKSITGATNILTTNPQDNDNIPPGYVAVSLIEALNGPPPQSTTTIRNTTVNDAADTPDNNDAVQAAEILNRSVDNGKEKSSSNGNPPEIRMSVLTNKDDAKLLSSSSTTTTTTTTTSASVLTTSTTTTTTLKSTNNTIVHRDKSPRAKTQSRSQQSNNRDSVKIVNEKNTNASLKVPTDADDDSDAEKLSPLLNHGQNRQYESNMQNSSSSSPLHIDGVDESIDDTDTDIDEQKPDKKSRPSLTTDGEAMLAGAEDSDYYTPEETHTTILSPLCPEKNKVKEQEKIKENSTIVPSSTLAAIKESNNSLPDSPISGGSAISARSSGDSYSSSSSTRQLLASIPITSSDPTTIRSMLDVKICDDKQHPLDKAVHV